MTEIMPYRAEHVARMKIRDLSPEMEVILTRPAYLQYLERIGPGFTMLIDGEVIGCLIFAKLLYPGVAEVLICMSDAIESHRLTVHRVCKKQCDQAQEMHGFRRLEARIPESATRNRKWAESIGFKQEGVIEAFGPDGEDYIQYGRVRRS